MILVVYVMIGLFDPIYTRQALEAFGEMSKALLPALVVVYLLLCVFNLTQGMQKKLQTLTGKHSGVTGWGVALLGGVLSHGPVYAWYPLLGQLRQQGVRPALLATFLYARSIKLPWLPLMIHYFGLSYTVVFSFYIMLFSPLNGYLTEFLLADKSATSVSGGAANE